MNRIGILERFFKYVIPLPNGCWLWIGYANGNKDRSKCRPKFRPTGEPMEIAYRWAYKYFIGNLNSEDDLHHFECRNGFCVNPTHVIPVNYSIHAAMHVLEHNKDERMRLKLSNFAKSRRRVQGQFVSAE